jgi:hypothetical protein
MYAIVSDRVPLSESAISLEGIASANGLRLLDSAMLTH